MPYFLAFLMILVNPYTKILISIIFKKTVNTVLLAVIFILTIITVSYISDSAFAQTVPYTITNQIIDGMISRADINFGNTFGAAVSLNEYLTGTVRADSGITISSLTFTQLPSSSPQIMALLDCNGDIYVTTGSSEISTLLSIFLVIDDPGTSRFAAGDVLNLELNINTTQTPKGTTEPLCELATPENPIAVSSVTDGTGGFDTLGGAFSITTTRIGSATYALVAANGDDGIQIIDITDPAVPTVVSSVIDGDTDGTSTFDTLAGAFEITTVTMDHSTYALVTGNLDDGIQIIDITDPAVPTVVSSITDGGVDDDNNTYDELDGPRDITTVTINESTYALIASFRDDGIQIIDITDPAVPIAVSSVIDSDIFPELGGASGITTITIGESTYALVASSTDDGIQIIDITDPAVPTAVSSITDGDTDEDNNTFDQLRGAVDITAVKIGSSTYALVAGSADNGVQIIDITDPAVPTAASSVTDGTTFDTLDGANNITTITIGESTYALVAGSADNGVQIIDITNPENPTAAYSVTDGDVDGGGVTFDTLAGANDITTTQVGTSIYALVASGSDNGIQIIRMVDFQPELEPIPPENPIAVSSVTDGVDGFDELDGARNITTVSIGESTYALVASFLDGGVQIINMTNPAMPTAVSSVTDGVDGFDTLSGARNLTTVTIGESTYALVTSELDDGIQIIDITNPAAPIAVSSVTDGSDDNAGDTFDTLDVPSGITTVTIGSSTYALVASVNDNGIQIIDITIPAAPTVVSSVIHDSVDGGGNAFDGLRGAIGITTIQINSTTYALVASTLTSSVQIIDISNPAAPIAVSSVKDGNVGDAFDELEGATGITTAKIGASTYALVASVRDDGVQIIDITDPAAPTAASSITDGVNGFNTLDGAWGISTTKIGASTYALVTSQFDNGIQIIDITDPTSPTAVSSITEGDTFDELTGARGITTVTIDSLTYALIASQGDDGIQIISVTEFESESKSTTPENPIAVSSVTDGVDGFDELDGARNVTTVTIGLSTYALVTGYFDNGVQIIDVTNPVMPTVVSSVTDGVGGFDTLFGARNITTVTIGQSTYALVTGELDDGIQIIDITNPAAPIAVSSVTDGSDDNAGDTFDTLDGTSGITTVTIGSSTYALVASVNDNGIQIIDITDPAAPTAVSSVIHDSVDGGGNTFDGLRGAIGITTIRINSTTYALVASTLTSSMQIIDISNPAAPTAVSSVTKGSVDGDGNTFNGLGGATGIATAKIGTSTYVLVASVRDDSVQIIDITDPAAPIAASSVTDGGVDGNGDTFDTLDGAWGISTIKIGASTYALVTSQFDNGIQIIDITDPIRPTAVSSITDGDTFDTLGGPRGITTFTIDSLTYALIASQGDDGIQIISVTEFEPKPVPERVTPENPMVVSSVTDGVGGFDTLDGARGITTVTINSSTYALVTAIDDDGIQIIDITNPNVPTAVSSIADGVGGFDTLNAAHGITTVVIGQSTYALVASIFDSSLQIIDISNPASPINVSSATDGRTDVNGDTFDTLGGATSVATVRVGTTTYALVAANVDDGVQIIDITNPARPTAVTSIIDGQEGAFGTVFDELDGAIDIATAKIGFFTYALVASNTDNGIQIIDVTNPRIPTVVSSINVGDTDGVNGIFDALLGPVGITTSTVGSSTYAIVASRINEGIQIIDITNPARPTAASSITDTHTGDNSAFNTLGGARDIAIFAIAQSTYAIVAADEDDGIQIIDITNPKIPTAVYSVTNGGVDSNGNTFDTLDGASGITTVIIDTSTYALVASDEDDGIQIIRISEPQLEPEFVATLANPIAISSVTDGVGAFDELDGASGITTVTINSSVYALVAAFDDDGIQIIDITNPAVPIAISSATDDVGGFNTLSSPRGITTVQIGDSTYALVTSISNSGLQIINITNPARPTVVSEVVDGRTDGNGNTFDTLGGAISVSTVRIGSSLYALVAANVDDGVQIINITNPARPTVVSSVTDATASNGSPFNELDGAFGITTVTVGPSTYALVVSRTDSGVQIIDITNPAVPTVASSIALGGTDGVSDTFDTLLLPIGITTVTIGESTYAIVTSNFASGVQIIDITNPARPTGVSSLADAIAGVSDTFDTLDGANGITTITIDQSTYAIVAADIDDGIQIIDITNPAAPTAVSSVTDGDVDDNDGTFDALGGATGITTVQIGTSIYALVASDSDNAVEIIRIVEDQPKIEPEPATPRNPILVSSVTDGVGGFDALNRAHDITTVTINSSIYALVASVNDRGIQIMDITDPAAPTAVSSIRDGATFDTLNGVNSVTTVKIGLSTYAISAAFSDDGIQIIDISDPATPKNVYSITDGDMDGNGNTFDTLDGANTVTTVKINSSVYAIVAASVDSGIQIIDITNPATPTAVSSATDKTTSNDSPFEELEGARGVTTVKIDSSTYAIVTAYSDSGVQIIDISNPAVPTVTSSIAENMGEFRTLAGPLGVTTVRIGSSTYALVASFFDSGVQIIDISNPATPTFASSVTDGDVFTKLKRATGITTVKVGSSTYALVTASLDHGVQIIDITDPTTPTSASTLLDNFRGFNQLEGAYGVTTVQIGTSIYALVVAEDDDSVQIIRIAESQPELVATPENPIAVSSVTDGIGSFDTLGIIFDVTPVKIGESVYALVASREDDGIQIIDITDPQIPANISSITDGDTDGSNGTFDTLDGATGIATIKIGESTYALITAFEDDGVQIIDITDPTTPIAVSSVTDGTIFEELDGAIDIATIKIGTSTYALVTSVIDAGMQIIDITNPAVPTAVSSITDGDIFDRLQGARGISIVTIGASIYALVTANFDNGVQIIDITNPAVPTAVSSIIDATAINGSAFDELDGATGITTIKIGSATYALVAAERDDGVQIIDITDPAVPTAVSSITDATTRNGSAFDELDGATDITVVKIGLSTYALVAADTDDGIQIIDISNPAVPTAVTSVTDDFGQLDGASDITTVQIGTSIYALVAAIGDSSVQIIRIAESQSKVVATPENPLAVTFVTDDFGGFDQLGGTRSISTVTIHSSIYALVAADTDDGIQIIDITNPENPTAVSSVTDGDVDGGGNTFDTLDGSFGIATIIIGESVYALVAANGDDGVQIIDISNPAVPTVVSSVTDGVGGFDELAGAFDVTTVTIGESVYALVAAITDDGVQIIDISNPAVPVAVSSVTDGVDTFDTLGGAESITTVTIGESVYALVTSFFDDGVQIIDISNPAVPVAVSFVTDGGGGGSSSSGDSDADTFDTLAGPRGITTVTIGESTYALVAAERDDGVQIIDITDPAVPTVVSSVTDDDDNDGVGTFDTLDGPRGITTVTINSSTYALVAAGSDDGIQIIDITDPAVPTAVSSVTDGVDGFGELAGAFEITTIQIGTSIYALATAGSDNGIQIIRIADSQPDPVATPENPIAVTSLVDGSGNFDELRGARSITTVTINSFTYALVASVNDNGIQIINMTNPARPTAVSSINDGDDDSDDGTFDTLAGANAITTVTISEFTYALVASSEDNGIQIIDITNPAMPTATSSVTDGSTDGSGNTFDTLGGAFGITTVIFGESTYALVAAEDDDGVQIIDITNPAAPTVTSFVTDGSGVGAFDTLDRPRDITTVTIGESTYALVASFGDNGIQIIDMTNPAAPTAVSSIIDGSTFDELFGVSSITTVTIGESTYALVAAESDDGVQIIDITNPAVPIDVSSVTDGEGGFDTLDSAVEITTIKIGLYTYALVASLGDDGVQIINITNPATPTATSSVIDGSAFDRLNGATAITTVQIDSSIYALVASRIDNGIQIIRIAESQRLPEPEPVATPENPLAVTSVTDGVDSFDGLLGPRDITTVTIGTSTYALVTAFNDSTVQIIDITIPTTPTTVSSITDGDTFDTLSGVGEISTVTIGSSTYALVTARDDNGIQIIDITNPAVPTAASSVIDGGTDSANNTFDTLAEPRGITTVKIGLFTYALVASEADDGIQIINISNPAVPTVVSSITDGVGVGTFDELDGASGITTVTVGESTYALVASLLDNGVQIINITNPAVPTVVSSITDGADFDHLSEASDITTVTVGESTYALVTASGDNGIQIIDITNPAVPTAVFSVTDGDTFDTLGGASDITTVTVDTSTYALVASPGDNGIQIIDITNPAVPTAASSITDEGVDDAGGIFDELDGAVAITTVQINLSIYALVASFDDDGIQIIRIAESQLGLEPEPEPIATPENPVAVSSVIDEVDSFDTLGSPFEIVTIKIKQSTYALVTALGDDGIQIIDITNPKDPIAVSSLTDDGPAVRLDDVRGVAAVQIDQFTYGLVVSFGESAVSIINMTNPATPTIVSSVTDDVGGFNTLGGASGIAISTIGESTYALVTASIDSGIQIIDITNPAVPVVVSSITEGPGTFDTLVGARGITTVTVGESTYALVTAFRDNDVQIIDITNPRMPTVVSFVTDNVDSFDELDGAGGITTVTVGESTYALVASFRDNGVQIIDITDPENPTAASSITDATATNGSPFDGLGGARDITTVTVGTSTYALVASDTDNGIQIIDITDPTVPTAASFVTDGVDSFDTLGRARGITTVQIDSSIYALVAARQDNGIQIIRIAESQPDPIATPENPIAVSSVTDGVDGFDTLAGATDITTVRIDSAVYALVVSLSNSAVQIINITDPENPTAVSSVTDGIDSFDTLGGAFDITTVTIGQSTYALVASRDDDSIQIIDITDPENPAAVSSVTDGIDSFDTLAGTEGITTVTIGQSTYALATSFTDDGIQIMDITDPENPTDVPSVTDGISGFDELDGATGITTVTIGQSTYALVASFEDDGIQIIDITDPATPIAVSSVTDGIGGFDELDGAVRITTVQIGASTYGLVASVNDDGIQIIYISDPTTPIAVSSVTDGDTFDTLDEARDITTVQIDQSVYALVAAFGDDGIQIIDITDPTIPTAVSSITDGAVDSIGGTFDELAGADAITTVQIGLSIYALVASVNDDGVQIIRIAESQPALEPESESKPKPEPKPEPKPDPVATPANPISVTSVTDGGAFSKLEGARDITTVKIGSATYALVTANIDNSVQIIDITNPATPTAVSTITDGGSDGVRTFDTLAGANGITTVQINSFQYVLVASVNDDGVQIIEITNPAEPIVVSSITDGNTYDTLDGASDITTVQIGESIYALVASFEDDGVQIIDITRPISPTAVSSITDGNTFDRLDGASGITTVKIGASTYALVASFEDDGVQIIDISNPVSPTAVSSITDGSTFHELDGASDITTVKIGDSTYALVASVNDDGIQIIDISDPAVPTLVSSVINGSIFDGLDGASDITTVKIGDSTYALVASIDYDGIQIIDITDPAVPIATSAVTDDGVDGNNNIFDTLDRAYNITTVQIGTSIYALVASQDDNGVQIIRIAENQPIPETVDPICELTLSAVSLDLGTVEVGTTTDEGSVAIQNSGNVVNNVEIGADYWCDAVDNGCTGSNGVIFPNMTSFATSPNISYASKQAFTEFSYDNTSGSPVRGTPALPFETPALFTLTPDETGTAYLQTLVELIPRDGGTQNIFTGAVSQEIILESNCENPNP